MIFLSKTNSIGIAFLTICFLTACSTSRKSFTKKDVRATQKLIGIEFSKKRIDTLYDYLVRNKKGYDSLRKYTIEHEVFPAILFDPKPSEFELPKSTGAAISWEVPEAIQLPEDINE